MTIPEMFDQRFGPRIRWAAGVVIVLGGLLNMGVFLRTGGEFLVVVCGFDVKYLEAAMTALLAGVVAYTVLGGMLSVLITDFLQFVVMSVGLIVVTALILVNVGWDKLVNTVQSHYGAGGFNPFVNPTMGWPYVLFNLLLNTAATLTWQATIARVLAAKDSTTGRKIYTRTAFFFVCRFLMPGIWGIAALATLGPAVAGDNTLHAMPKFLSTFLPVGVMGILVAAMLAADMSTDSSYMLTWGSVITTTCWPPSVKIGPNAGACLSTGRSSHSSACFCSFTDCGIRSRATSGPTSA
jgi:SSS family solute:Na+ symporter